MISSIISRLVILVFGTLYPAYASYKAVRTKNLKEYVKWMMYWIVFALFTCTETFTDVFLSWFPFYYEVKIVLVLWLLSPATKGSSILYRKFVHPALCRREQEIDEYIAKAKDQGYHTVLNLGTKGVNYATTVIMQTAIKGGGGLVQQLRKSYSLSDLTECEPREERAGADEADDVLAEPRLVRRAIKSGFAARRSASESNSRQPMYFPEVDVDVRSTRSSRSDEPDFSHIKSTEDISSGYSSADNSASLTRAGSVGAGAGGGGGAAGGGRSRARSLRATAVTNIKRPQAAEDNEVHIEELQDDDPNTYTDMPSLVNISSSCLYLSRTNPPFIYQYDGNQVKILQVLSQLPISEELSPKDNPFDQRDQNNISTEKKIKDDSSQNVVLENNILNNDSTDNTLQHIEINQQKHDSDNNVGLSKIDLVNTADSLLKEKPCSEVSQINNDTNNTTININLSEKEFEHKTEQDETENDNLTLDNSGEIFTDNYSSDDEASFGTPNESPKSNRKNVKGKYGKNKAPLPPSTEINTSPKVVESKDVTKEILEDDKNLKEEEIKIEEKEAISMPDTLSPSSEVKKRQKSKSPIRIPKPSTSGFGKLLQLPGKLAFWHRTDDKPSDNISNLSGDKSRSSSIGHLTDNVSNKDDTTLPSNESNDISEVLLKPKSLDDISFKDAIESENEITSHNIIERSDILQKLIEAKIESHPEYKFVPLKDEIQTTSKSTDV
ncbi:PREDICTED: uncharacterized protein LOC106099276 isoform X2 [Papilio polytes]|uniref:uncharacterized protein LOC106099276 isoform X2 n=1 Tax=Papilio polytes TaxID=76194 RepID=UPI000675E329|nr:PREDICTED: uncharacterized protein LOC106099276 isoform X2 [Papilio polytes]